MPNQNQNSFLWKWMAGVCVCVCVHVWCVSSRWLGTDPAVRSKLSRALHKFSTVTMKLGSSSEQQEWCLHASFSQKHRHHSKMCEDDLEVPLSNQDLQPTSLSWDNRLHILFFKKLSMSHLVFILHSCWPWCQLLSNCPVVTAMEELTSFQFLFLLKTAFHLAGEYLTRRVLF